MKENLDRMLEKLDLILGLNRDCNFTLKRIESRGESWNINSVPSDDVRGLKVVEGVYASSTVTSVVENLLVNFNTQIIDEIHEFSESSSGDAYVRVKSSTHIPTDVHTHDNNTSDAECESVIELQWLLLVPPSSQLLKFFYYDPLVSFWFLFF